MGTGFGSLPTEGTGLGSLPTEGAVDGSPGTEGTGDGAADGSPGALGTGDGSAEGSVVASSGAEGAGEGSAAADGTADGSWSPETAASAAVHAVARSTTTRSLPAAATPRAAIPRGARPRRRGASVLERKGLFAWWRVTKRSVSTGARPMTGSKCDLAHTEPSGPGRGPRRGYVSIRSRAANQFAAILTLPLSFGWTPS